MPVLFSTTIQLRMRRRVAMWLVGDDTVQRKPMRFHIICSKTARTLDALGEVCNQLRWEKSDKVVFFSSREIVKAVKLKDLKQHEQPTSVPLSQTASVQKENSRNHANLGLNPERTSLHAAGSCSTAGEPPPPSCHNHLLPKDTHHI